MKTTLAIAPHSAEPLAFAVLRDLLEASIAKVARLGYDGIELALGRD
jgi:sugar phosphate isomerase/epimerase